MNPQPYEIALHTQCPIDAQALRVLYDAAQWWPNRDLHSIAQMLERDVAIGVWQASQLIGFARAVTDGHFRAYIEDVVVEPAYRRRGIAVQMLTQLLEQLKHIETISLFCSPELIGLYEQLHFRARRSQVVMHH